MLGLERFSGPLLSALRIVSGLLFLEHGTAKLFTFPLTQMFPHPPEPGTPQGTMLFIAGILEVVGGALVTLGLFTRPVAFILSGQMAVAYWLVHAPQSPFPAVNQGDAAILFCFIFLYIAAVGGGSIGVDAALRKKP
jgi:putative oxidoreductase